ncbi:MULTISPECIES: histidine kinase [Nostoc]|uniref:Histidine kinase n=1 Tax=Nostoc paludosum FACHB-159 TaxID=2692908 RepID=A0ABR8KEL3_9NOSO|nr:MULTISPECIES: histidine kinase [Nostoc]MBD2680726.1 histidine kinase [Nostoc sp. FACHB-857]MBD2737169.1 histidine kinase [Nostoc paludosum FACHB-159]
MGRWGDARTRGRGEKYMPNAQCPMPNAQCPMPYAQFL